MPIITAIPDKERRLVRKEAQQTRYQGGVRQRLLEVGGEKLLAAIRWWPM
jgi:hypothetical protein